MQDLTDRQHTALQTLAEDAGARHLHDIYAAHGAALRFAGGCVRDALMGHEIGDTDLATPAVPQDGLSWLTAAGLTVRPTGIAHGTITAIVNGTSYEITTLRRDVTTDGRHATVVFGTAWAEDALRRDFTMNGLFCDFEGKVFDFVGGMADSAEGRVRFIGDAETRCREDYLRILRLFRFWSRFGKSDLDDETLSAVRSTLDGVPRLSRQRVWMELKKLLVTQRAGEALQLMAENDVLSALLDNQFCKPAQVTALQAVERSLDHTPSPLRTLAALLHYRTQTGWTIDWRFAHERFALSNTEADHLRALQRAGQAIGWWMERLLAAMAAFPRDVVIDMCLLAVASGHETLADLKQILPDLMTVDTPVCPVTATDLLSCGYSPGPELGMALNTLRDYWLETNCQATRDACLALL